MYIHLPFEIKSRNNSSSNISYLINSMLNLPCQEDPLFLR